MSEWFDVKEIRVREHTARSRPGSRPTLMIIYELEGHGDAFDHLSFESEKQFARDKAADRWHALKGEMPVPESTEEALEREGEITVPHSISLVQDGKWERVAAVRFLEDVQAETAISEERTASLAEDHAFLEETTAPKAFDFSKYR